MAVLDASALIAFLTREAAAAEVEPLLRSSEAKIAAVNVTEVVDVLLRGTAIDRRDLDRAIDPLIAAGDLQVVEVADGHARRAGEIRATYYHRTRCDVSVADCIAAATAESFGEALATSDRHLAFVAREIGVDVIALPDSSGARP